MAVHSVFECDSDVCFLWFSKVSRPSFSFVYEFYYVTQYYRTLFVVVVVVVVYFILISLLYLAFSANLGLLCIQAWDP